MKHSRYTFSKSTVDYYFDTGFSQLKKIVDPKQAILITDENVHAAHGSRFKGWNMLVLKAGEEYKIQATVDAVIDQLIDFQADRKTTLIGIGGGVITDLTGYIASVYMRGIPFGFIPTSLLAMVDASVGGKNGIDVGVYKNMVGTIRQPGFLLYDMTFLSSLPDSEWKNGFAEIVKHASIKDAAMFRQLEKGSLEIFQKQKRAIADLVQRNVTIKTKVVKEDEFETGERRLLNFGHTLGHALENQYELSHGQAISIGMTYAAFISEDMAGFSEAERVSNLLNQYGLPGLAKFENNKVFDVMKMDKKRVKKEMNYVLLEKIGKAIIKSIPVSRLQTAIKQLNK
jgi:3-dehydroquinate synthase